MDVLPVISRVHLDCLGGLAGDMFNAALMHAFPELVADATAAAEALAGVPCRTPEHRDAVLTGRHFQIEEPHHPHHHHHDHAHTAWRDIRARIAESALPQGVKRHATGIFALLAHAEARVHGRDTDEVTFHEVGNADSIADIVAAACMIDTLGDVRWTVGALPLGSGRVRTAHGWLPVPAPATALLLEGFAFVDDGIGGERVTPTGAAILRYLSPAAAGGPAGNLARTGIGFGTRELPGISNVVRVLAFAEAEARMPGTHRELAVVSFEVDDQSAEDLAIGLDRVRQTGGVHDVLQMPAFGKKGRMATHVQVLAHPDALEAAVDACFRETTTIGLRTHLVRGRALPRDARTVRVHGQHMRVKRVERPGGRTVKAEADDLRDGGDHATRTAWRREAERLAEDADGE